jgi:hypothetical protein
MNGAGSKREARHAQGEKNQSAALRLHGLEFGPELSNWQREARQLWGGQLSV